MKNFIKNHYRTIWYVVATFLAAVCIPAAMSYYGVTVDEPIRFGKLIATDIMEWILGMGFIWACVPKTWEPDED